jgi:hypothetical protein
MEFVTCDCCGTTVHFRLALQIGPNKYICAEFAKCKKREEENEEKKQRELVKRVATIKRAISF